MRGVNGTKCTQRHRKGFLYHGLQISLFNSVSLSMKRQKRTCHVMQTGEYLDSLAELFKDLERLPASPASAMFRFYISEAQKQSVIIPAGTRISFDGAIFI